MTKQQQIDDPRSPWNTAEPDEPVFLLRGRDRHAPQRIQQWIEALQKAREAPELQFEADQQRLAMLRYQIERGATGLSLEPLVPPPDPNKPRRHGKTVIVGQDGSEFVFVTSRLKEAVGVQSLELNGTFSIHIHWNVGAGVVLNFKTREERDVVRQDILDIVEFGH